MEAFRVDTTVLRVLAIVLIANSHLEDFYPFRQLAADGLLGNSLFFMLSGLGIALSARTGTDRFVDWYRRRLSRIYPALWLTMLAGPVLLQGAWRRWTPVDFLSAFVWPTHYAFLMLIVLFYPAFYFLRAMNSAKIEWAVMVALTAAYVGVAVVHYDLHVLSWIFYFQVMLLGGLLAGRVKAMAGSIAPAPDGPDGCDGDLRRGQVRNDYRTTSVAYRRIALVDVPDRHQSAGRLRFVEPCRSLSRRPRLGPMLAGLAGLTLEIYLVHGFVYTHPSGVDLTLSGESGRVLGADFAARLAGFGGRESGPAARPSTVAHTAAYNTRQAGKPDLRRWWTPRASQGTGSNETATENRHGRRAGHHGRHEQSDLVRR